jgi:alginate O-acetyltransferase complex protein AlgI
MQFSSADYPVFLGAVFFLYGLARAGSWPGAIGRWALMLLLGDLVYLLLAKNVGALWDPLGGVIYHLLAQASAPTEADAVAIALARPPIWHYVVGLAVVVGFARLGYRGAAGLAGPRGQKWLGVGLAIVLVTIGATVLFGDRSGQLSAISAAFAEYGHLGFLAALSTALGASARPEGRAYARLVILFLVSCIFYHAWAAAMSGGYQYLLALLLGTIVLDYYLALWIARTEDRVKRKALLILSLVSNLGILAVFKYCDFFTQDVLDLSVEPLNLILPAGISFHTFQSLSYTIDVYRGQLKPTRSVLQFATFVLFFPQLVAGPIVRATELMPQLAELPRIDHARASDGLFRIMVGLFKKIAIADFLAIAIVDRVFANPENYSSLEVLVGVYAYALQIYLDFSAYSDIAIGSAQLLGFELPENFRTPYRSANLQEFWRRWHISLSTWLRDYLYIPLGGSRRGGLFTYRNLIITMLLGGLWHGASWTFIVWGALHGFGLAVTRVFQRESETNNARAIRIATICGVVALVGFGIHMTVLTGLGAWGDLIAAWIYLVPLWAALTVAASHQPVLIGGGGRAMPREAQHLRLLACGYVLGLLIALHQGWDAVWLPLLLATPILAGLADLVEIGPDLGELGRLALAGWRRFVGVVLVFNYVCLAWVFFRATSFDNALLILQRIGAREWDSPNLIPVVVFAVAAGFVAHFFPGRTFAWLRARFVGLLPIEQGGILACAALVLGELSHPTIVPFIYFQF